MGSKIKGARVRFNEIKKSEPSSLARTKVKTSVGVELLPDLAGVTEQKREVFFTLMDNIVRLFPRDAQHPYLRRREGFVETNLDHLLEMLKIDQELRDAYPQIFGDLDTKIVKWLTLLHESLEILVGDLSTADEDVINHPKVRTIFKNHERRLGKKVGHLDWIQNKEWQDYLYKLLRNYEERQHPNTPNRLESLYVKMVDKLQSLRFNADHVHAIELYRDAGPDQLRNVRRDATARFFGCR